MTIKARVGAAGSGRKRSSVRGGIGCEDLVVVAEPDAILVCRHDACQSVKTLVDGLKCDGRSIASGREREDASRRILTTTASLQVEQWTLKACETFELPIERCRCWRARLRVWARWRPSTLSWRLLPAFALNRRRIYRLVAHQFDG